MLAGPLTTHWPLIASNRTSSTSPCQLLDFPPVTMVAPWIYCEKHEVQCQVSARWQDRIWKTAFSVEDWPWHTSAVDKCMSRWLVDITTFCAGTGCRPYPRMVTSLPNCAKLFRHAAARLFSTPF